MVRIAALAALAVAAAVPAFAHNADGTHTHWDVTYVVVEVDGEPLEGIETPPDVTFTTAGEMYGFGGCNRFRGGYKSDGKTIEVSPLATTMMLCPEDVMKLEQSVLQSFEAAESVRRDGDRLFLVGADGETLLELTRKPTE